MNKIAGWENKLNIDYLIYIAGNKKKDKTYDFHNFKAIGRCFGREIYNNDLPLDDALELKIRLKNDIDIFQEFAKPNESVKKGNK